MVSHDNTISIVTGQSGVWIPAGARNFSFLQNNQIGCWAHPASYSMGTKLFPVGKVTRV